MVPSGLGGRVMQLAQAHGVSLAGSITLLVERAIQEAELSGEKKRGEP